MFVLCCPVRLLQAKRLERQIYHMHQRCSTSDCLLTALPNQSLSSRPSGWSGRSTTCGTRATTTRWACRWERPRWG